MNILITGSNGFIGRNLLKQLPPRINCKITTLNRGDCDLLDSNSVDNYFIAQKTRYDLVLHCAIQGGRRNKQDSSDILYKNIIMLYNLLRNQNYYENIISFGSGAELDRRFDINENTLISDRYPIDPYGLSKHIIHKIANNEPKLSSFRIYNCFGIDEQPDRMIRGNIHKYMRKEEMTIYQDKKMDFFYIDDLVSAICFFINQKQIPKYFECCYKEKYSLLDIANMINNLDNHKVNINIQDKTISNDYCGSHQELPIEYIGLKKSLNIIYNYYLGSNSI